MQEVTQSQFEEVVGYYASQGPVELQAPGGLTVGGGLVEYYADSACGLFGYVIDGRFYTNDFAEAHAAA